MKTIALVIMTVVVFDAHGQSHLLGASGGVSWTNMRSSSNTLFSQTEPRTGIAAALTYLCVLKSGISLGADLIYNQRGFRDEFVFTNESGSPTGKTFTFSYDYNYVSLPIKAGYVVGTTFFGFANLGVVPSLLTNASMSNNGGADIGAEAEDITTNVSSFDLAGLVEIGAGYKIEDRYWVYASFEYQHSITSFTNSDYYADYMMRHYGMSLSLGFRYELTSQ